MNYLGSERVITNSFTSHNTAEDYAGAHKSNISFNGYGKVIKIINYFHSHEDSVNYNNYLNNRNNWKDGNYYNCVSITGKIVKMHYSELGGNQIYIETYYNNQKYVFHFAHLDNVLVSVGDIVKPNQVFALQGNTGLVLSNKSINDETYGSHVHFEVTDINGNYINPREFASGNISTTYIEQSNTIDSSKRQIQILVDKINIRENPNQNSNDLGDVYNTEVYTILDEVDSDTYTWYKIKTNLDIIGYVASKKSENWIKVIEPNNDIIEEIQNSDKDDEYEFLFKCEKEDYYYIKLKENECLYIKKRS